MRQKIRCFTGRCISIGDLKDVFESKRQFEARRAETMLQIAEFVANLAETQPEIVLKFAADATTPPTVLAALGRSQNEAIRAVVARNPSTDDLTAYFLRDDECADVRQELVRR